MQPPFSWEAIAVSSLLRALDSNRTRKLGENRRGSQLTCGPEDFFSRKMGIYGGRYIVKAQDKTSRRRCCARRETRDTCQSPRCGMHARRGEENFSEERREKTKEENERKFARHNIFHILKLRRFFFTKACWFYAASLRRKVIHRCYVNVPKRYSQTWAPKKS